MTADADVLFVHGDACGEIFGEHIEIVQDGCHVASAADPVGVLIGLVEGSDNIGGGVGAAHQRDGVIMSRLQADIAARCPDIDETQIVVAGAASAVAKDNDWIVARLCWAGDAHLDSLVAAFVDKCGFDGGDIALGDCPLRGSRWQQRELSGRR